MIFEVVPTEIRIPSNAASRAYLHVDNWDDWFKYSTMYYLTVFDERGNKHEIGSVKIGQFRMTDRRPVIPNTFVSLNNSFFSLGQDADFYENLYKLGEDLREIILEGLNDVVSDQGLFSNVLAEDVTKTSLLRSVSPASVQGQFHRLLQGGARLTSFNFRYELPRSRSMAGVDVEFSVVPESNPPSNIHVLIGRNGVGKTHLLNNMVSSLVDRDANHLKVGSFSSIGGHERTDIFSGVVSVSFSAFDPFDPLPEQRDKTAGIQYSYVGLKRTTNRGGERGTPMSHEMLTNEFVKSMEYCIKWGKSKQWKEALKKLEADPLFAEASLGSLLDIEDDQILKKTAATLFKKLSSGHGVVLLTITKLVQTVEEKTLVLLDEPEAHLHPPLLSAFVRALSDLLVHRNGVAIIATHSPVIVQEVPSDCVWKMRRTGYEAVTERPSIETFGENVGVLTREIFGLEVTQSGFHQLLISAVNEAQSYADVIDSFDEQLGTEGKAIARGLIAERQARNGGL